MHTHIELEDKLIDEVLRMGHFNSPGAAINIALREYLNLLKRRQLLELKGKVRWEGNLEQMRQCRFDDQG